MRAVVIAVILPGCGDDDSCSDDRVIVVEHGHLTRRDRERGLLEAERESVVRRLHERGHGVGAVAELRLGTLDRQVEPAADLTSRTSSALRGPTVSVLVVVSARSA